MNVPLPVVPLQASISSRLTTQLKALQLLPPHIAAPAIAGLVQALHSAMEQYPADAVQQGQGQGQSHAPALQSLYSGLLQQALTHLMDGAVVAFAALPVMGHVEGRQESDRPLQDRLLALLGQVSWDVSTDGLSLQ